MLLKIIPKLFHNPKANNKITLFYNNFYNLLDLFILPKNYLFSKKEIIKLIINSIENCNCFFIILFF